MDAAGTSAVAILSDFSSGPDTARLKPVFPGEQIHGILTEGVKSDI
jgi:hypothetical protein